MAMAHGYYRTCGKPAAVMVHVTVGTANAMNGLINAARDNIPLLLAAGRTPLTETGHISSRNRSIHWGQESFDQGGMVREYVKWDYELRGGQPVDAVVDRALDIAMTEPRGPVYLTLPREVLTDAAVATRRDTVRPLGSLAPEPAWAAIEEAASLIAKAEFPLIITSSIGRDPAAIDALAALAEEFFDDRMAAGNDEEFAGGGKFRPSVAAVGGELRKRSEDVELRDGSRRLAQARGLGSDAGAQIDEKLALDFEDALVGGENFSFVIF